MKKTLFLFVILALVASLSAQSAKTPPKAQAILAFTDDETQVQISDPQGKALAAVEGLVIPVGSIIKTMKSTAEIQLKPNGTIIKLAASTTFKIEALREGESGSNDFAVLGGKIRAVAAKLAGASGGPGYNVRTPTANCGVRGTDFAVKYDLEARQDWVCVQEGLVDFTNATTGDTVAVGSGQFANTFDAVFQAAPVDAQRIAELFSDVDFVVLTPVAQEVQKPAPQIALTPQNNAPAPGPEAGQDEEKGAPNPLIEFLTKVFGMEVGSVTIDGTTYSKAVLSPVLTVDDFRLGLYLPVVYTNDLFSQSDWYRPRGNDEWSFGSDQSSNIDGAKDFGTDLLLKVKFLEWGSQDDPFYLKVGNLRTMTLGHGSVVQNLANDQDFPSVRKVGINAGVRLGNLALEGLVDDATQPSVVGGRIAVGLVGDQVALGVQGVADLEFASEVDASLWGDPILLVGGVDLQLFRLSGPLFSTTAFVDVNTLALYNRVAQDATGFTPAIEGGLNTKTFWHDELGSLGGEAGVFGKVAVVDYRLSFQAERGVYRNALFQGNYYRTRTETLAAVIAYTTDAEFAQAADQAVTLGIYGGAGFNLGLLTLETAYRYPLVFDGESVRFSEESDAFRLRLEVPKDKIPFVELSGSVTYERTQFAKTIADGGDLLDARSLFRAEVVWGMAPGADLVVGVTTAALRSVEGDLVFEDGLPKVGPTISIDTRVSF